MSDAATSPRAAPTAPHWFVPQVRDAGLARHAHRVELRGRPSGLRWPDLCASCGTPARERIAVRKVFVRRHRLSHSHGVVGRRRYPIDSLAVPFCDACAARHRSLAPTMTALRRSLTYFRSALVIPVVGAGYMAFVTSGALEGTAPGDPGGAVARAVVAFFLVIAVATPAGMVLTTRRYRVLPQTEITLACDYSDDVGSLVDGSRRVYSIRSGAFAEAFARLNRDRAWTDEHRRRALVPAALLIAAVAGAVALLGWFGR